MGDPAHPNYPEVWATHLYQIPSQVKSLFSPKTEISTLDTQVEGVWVPDAFIVDDKNQILGL